MGTPTSIALDPSGAAYIAGSAVNTQGVGTSQMFWKVINTRKNSYNQTAEKLI
jgi:hypothetical protein